MTQYILKGNAIFEYSYPLDLMLRIYKCRKTRPIIDSQTRVPRRSRQPLSRSESQFTGMTESGIWTKRAFEHTAAEYEQAQKDFGGESRADYTGMKSSLR